MVGERGSKQEEGKNQEEEESHSWRWNAMGGFGEVTGSSRETVLAGGDCADGVTAPGRRVTWETLNLIYLCLFLLLYVSQFPFILPCPSFSQTHMNNFSVVQICKSGQTKQHMMLYASSANAIIASLPLLYLMNCSSLSQGSVSLLCCFCHSICICDKKEEPVITNYGIVVKFAPAICDFFLILSLFYSEGYIAKCI